MAAAARTSSPLHDRDDTQRPSLVSSPASLLTAPQKPSDSVVSSRNSESPRIPPNDPETANTLHALALGHVPKVSTQEVHIVKVTEDALCFDVDSTAGPPPPSPPSSTGHEAEFGVFPPVSGSKPEPPHSNRPITFEEPLHEPRISTSSRDAGRDAGRSSLRFVSLSTPSDMPGPAGPSSQHHGLTSRSSTDTKSSLLTTRSRETQFTVSPASSRQRSGSILQPDTPLTEEPPPLPEPLKGAPDGSTAADGHLHPPASHKAQRRNTMGSGSTSSARPTRSLTVHAPHSYGPEPSVASGSMFEDGAIGSELASDIQQQAEQIRRERITKRVKAQQEAEKAKAQQEAERALTRTASLLRGSSGRGEQPLVGNLIGEGHVNYVLMYNMLTGIRIAVSRCQAKIRRPLTEEDYTARHKFSFDIVGNELTPSAKYDFKFKDYAPWVFRELREDHFHLDPADYLLSLTAKYILSELGSPGKSGSFFYFSRDYRFIIKTIRYSEHKFLRSILPQYYEHVKNNPHTLLSRFYGLHRVKLPHGRKIHFVIMNNLFPAHKDIHETYDLKGSTVGRVYPEDKAAQNPRAVLKDLNWINRGKKLELGPEKRALLTEQMRRDSELLKKLRVMDYSLLVGIHNMQRGNRDNVRSNTLKIFSPDMPAIRRKATQSKGPSSPEAIAMRRIMRESDPKRLGSGTFKLPEEDTGERQYFLFYQDEGGLRATDETNDGLDTIYYLGIIDILTPYSSVKKLEHFWKGLQADRHKISPVPPVEYAERFFRFMKAIMRSGDHGEKVEDDGNIKAE